jgi:hypothetical protein
MFKSVITAIALAQLYKLIKNDYTHNPLYSAGFIDENGNSLHPQYVTMEQKEAKTPFNLFALNLKRTVENYPFIKYALLRTLMKSVFTNEAAESLESTVSVGRFVKTYNDISEGTLCVVTKQDSFHLTGNSVSIYTESGAFVVPVDVVKIVDLVEDEGLSDTSIMTTDATAKTEMPLGSLIKRATNRILRRNKNRRDSLNDKLQRTVDDLNMDGSDRSNAAKKSDD